MADSTINGLTALTGANVDNTADQFPIWDNSAATTSKITRTELMLNLPNVGIGVTPSAWQSTFKVLQFANGTSVGNPFNGEASFFASNTLRDSGGNWVRMGSGYASMYYQVSGKHQWFVANTGAAASALSFSDGGQAMTLDASGNLLFKTNGTASAPTIANADNPDTGLYWPTDADTLAIAVGGSDAVYIDANRRVGIGTPTPNAGLVISSSGAQGFEFSPNAAGVAQLETYNRSTAAYFSLRINSDDLRICTGSSATERLRIKSTGQLNFTGLAADPASATAGDVYYNNSTNKLRCYNGTTWNDLF